MTGRLDAVDLARFIALAGMMLAHLGPRWVIGDPPLADVVAGGRAAPLFAVLAGVSLTIVERRDPAGSGSVRATVLRAAVLVLLGLALASIEGVGLLVILAYYGLLFLVLLPFRRLRTGTLFALAFGWALVGSTAVFGLRRWLDLQPPGEQPGLDALGEPLDLAGTVLFTGGYPVAVWVAYGLLGLALGRLDLRRLDLAPVLAAVGLGLVLVTLVPAGLSSSWAELFQPGHGGISTGSWDNLLIVGQHTSTPLNVVSAMGSALLAVGACVALCSVASLEPLLRPLRVAGAMPLTLYVVHVLMFWAGREHGFSITSGTYREWFIHLVLLVAAANLWARWRSRGPLEELLRRVTSLGRR